MDSTPEIEGVTFDAAGTLIHLTESVGESYSRVARRFEIHAEPTALNAAFRATWKRTPAPFSDSSNQQGLFGESTLLIRENDTEKEWWRALVRDVFSEVGHDNVPRFNEFFEALYDHFEEPGCWQLDPAAPNLLNRCRERNLKIGLLSNFDHRLRRILTDCGAFDYFDGVILSGEVQASKPDLRMFRAIQRELKISDPGKILHIGDDPVCDIEGAERAGFQSFRVGKEVSLSMLSKIL